MLERVGPVSVAAALFSLAALGVGMIAALVWIPSVRSTVCWLGAVLDKAVYGDGYESYDVRGLILPSSTISTTATDELEGSSTRRCIASASLLVSGTALVAAVSHLQLLQVAAVTALLCSVVLWYLLRSSLDETTGGIVLLHRRNRLNRWLTRHIPMLESLAYPTVLQQLGRDHGFATTADFLRASASDERSDNRLQDVVRAWGNLIAVPSLTVSDDELEDWAHQSDELADAALNELLRARVSDQAIPQDNLEAMATLAERDGFDDCRAFWESCTALPSLQVGAHPAVGARADSHAWTEAEVQTLQSGQQMFFQYATGLLTSMLHGSLATGFALPRMVRVLETTGYLLGRPGEAQAEPKHLHASQADKTWDRLMHTTGWVVDVMQCGPEGLLPPRPLPAGGWSRGGAGWRAVVKVRLIHARVRRTVLARATSPSDRGFYPPRDGIPINQTDMAATLGAFCAVPLISLAQLGLKVPQDQANAFVALWRVVGCYSGVDEKIVQRYFASPAASQAFTIMTGLHLSSLPPLPLDPAEANGGGAIAVRLLGSVADRPPTNTTLESHIALVRYLAGPELATVLGLPDVAPAAQWGSVWLYKVLVALPPTVGRWHPRRAFENKRLKVARMLIPALLQTQGTASRARLGESFAHQDTLGPEKIGAPDWPAIRRLHLQVTLEMIAVVAAVATLPVWLPAMVLVVGGFYESYSSL